MAQLMLCKCTQMLAEVRENIFEACRISPAALQNGTPGIEAI